MIVTQLPWRIHPVKYPTNLSYQNAIAVFSSFIYSKYFKPTGRQLAANIIEVKDPDIWFCHLKYLNGTMNEGWGVDWDTDGYLSESRWENSAFFWAQGEKWDDDPQLFACASYLLITKGRAAFRYASAWNYRVVWWFDTYDIALGRPLGACYKTSTGLWRRKFAYGAVEANPTGKRPASAKSTTRTLSTSPEPTAKGLNWPSPVWNQPSLLSQ